MLNLTMNCYYRSARGEAPVLRDRLKIKAAGRSIAIEEAYRQADFLRATYFELRDPSQSDNLVYSSDETLSRAAHASYSALPSAMTAPAMLNAVAHPAPTFKTLEEFHRWFGAEMRVHRRAPYLLLDAAMKGLAAMKNGLPGHVVDDSPLVSAKAARPRSRKRSSPKGQPAARLPS